MAPSISLSALLWGAVFVTSCSAATSQTVSCTSQDASIVQFQKDVANSTAFCSYWSGSSTSPTDNPLGNLNATVISQVCQCISAHPTLVTKKPASSTTSSVVATIPTTSCSPKDANITTVSQAFLQPLVFCKYYISGTQKRSYSPVSGVGPAKLSSVCSCATATPALFSTSSATASSTHQVTTSKATASATHSSSKAAVTTATSKPVSATTTKPVSSSPKSTSTPKSGSTSKPSSATKPASSTTKPASSTTKPASSTTKPASSTTKSASSATKSISSSTKSASSGTKTASSITKSASSSAKSASSSTKSPTTSGKPSTSTLTSTKSESSKPSSTTKTAASMTISAKSLSTKSTTTLSTSSKVASGVKSTSASTSSSKAASSSASNSSSKPSSVSSASKGSSASQSSSKLSSTTKATSVSGSSSKSASTGKASSIASTQHTSSHQTTSSTQSAKASLITGSLPATATSQTASAANVPASTKIAANPAVPSSVNKAALANLSPSKNNTLAFKDAAASSFAANSNATFKYAAVMLDYSSLVNSVNCSTKNATLSIKFTSDSVSTQAYKIWTQQSSLLFVTSSSSCGTNGSDIYFLASSMSESANAIVTVKGSVKLLSQVMTSYAVKFSTGSSTTTTSTVKTNTKLSANGAIAQLQHAINSLSSSKLVTTPWGSQSQLFQYIPSAVSIFSNLNFYESLSSYAISDALLDGSIVSPEVSMYCIDCSVGGALGYLGSYSSVSGQASLAMTLAGRLDFNFKVGINAFAPLTTSVNIPVGQFALPSVQAGNFLSIQPMVQVSLVGNLSINAPGQVVIGSHASWSDVSITLNTNNQLSSISGAPVVNYPFSVEGPVEGGFSLTAQAAIVLQYSGINGGATTRVSFLDSRTVTGQSEDDDSNCDGIMWSSSYSALDSALAGSSAVTLQFTSGLVNQICVDQDTDVGNTIVTNTATSITTGTATFITDDSWTTATDAWFTDDQTTATGTNTWTDTYTVTATFTATGTDTEATAGTQTQTQTDFTFAFTGTGAFTAGGPQHTDSSSGGDDDGGDDGSDDGGDDNGRNWPWNWGDSGTGRHGKHGHTGSTTTTQSPFPSTTVRTTTSVPVVMSTTTTTTTTSISTRITTTSTSTSTSTTAQAVSKSSTTSSTSPSAPANAASTRTPAAAGCIPNLYTFQTSDDQLWQLNSTVGYSGDLGTVEAGSIADCINQCDSYGGSCSAITWLEYGATIPYCYLSSSKDLSTLGSISGYVGYSAVRLSGQSCISTQAPSCPGDDGGYYRSSTGYAYGLKCATQYTGTVLAYVDSATDLQDCLEACDTVTDCASASFAYGGSLSAPSCTIYNSTTSAVVSASLGYSVDSGFAIKS